MTFQIGGGGTDRNFLASKNVILGQSSGKCKEWRLSVMLDIRILGSGYSEILPPKIVDF